MQNIQDWMTLDQDMKRATDYVTNVTKCQTPEENKTKETNTKEDNNIDDILNYCKSNE